MVTLDPTHPNVVAATTDPALHLSYTNLRAARDTLLLFEARDVPFALHRTPDAVTIVVAAEHRDRASRELEAYRAENDEPAPTFPWDAGAPHSGEPAVLGYVFVLLFAARFIVGAAHRTAGMAHAERILSGQWWRALTALTLHADAAHLVGNLVAGSVVIYWLATRVGSGVAGLLVLLTGGLGNLLNAYLQLSTHRSIGASTSVFAAVGLLAALATADLRTGRRRRRTTPRRRLLRPASAALAIFALTGVGTGRVDVLAHVTGMVAGFGLGSVPFWRRAKGAFSVQAGATAATGALLIIAWATALLVARPAS